MTKKQFKGLEIGQIVRLLVPRNDYSCGHKTPDGRIYVPKGTVGEIGAINVPKVFRRGVFACVDFRDKIDFEDKNGKPVNHWSKPGKYRTSINPEDAEIVQ